MTSEDFLKKICLSLYLKRLRVRGSWRLNKDCNILTPTLIAVSGVSFFFLQVCSTGGPGAQLFAGWWLSLLHLITNWSPKLHSCDFPYHILPPTSLIPNCLTSCLDRVVYSSTPTQSLEWHVWSSSSRNNCHAVHRSLSFGASVYDCSLAFTLSHFISQIRQRDFFRLLAIGMCHFLPEHHFGMACLPGPKSIYNT